MTLSAISKSSGSLMNGAQKYTCVQFDTKVARRSCQCFDGTVMDDGINLALWMPSCPRTNFASQELKLPLCDVTHNLRHRIQLCQFHLPHQCTFPDHVPFSPGTVYWVAIRKSGPERISMSLEFVQHGRILQSAWSVGDSAKQQSMRTTYSHVFQALLRFSCPAWARPTIRYLGVPDSQPSIVAFHDTKTNRGRTEPTFLLLTSSSSSPKF